jgi:sortase A
MTARTTRQANAGWRGHLWLVLMIAGFVLCGYVGWQYLDMYRQQKELAVRWQEQQSAAPDSVPVVDTLTRLQIPKIDLDAIVVDGTTRKDLKIGPGRITSTAEPGESGNAVITGHRDTFFRHIYELSKGDVIQIRRKGELLKFEVTGKRVVDPEDLSVLRQSPDSQLTLITCYPTYYIGPAPERLVVFSKLTERTADTSRAAK